MVAEQKEARQALPATETEALLLAHLSAEPVHVDDLTARSACRWLRSPAPWR